MVVLFPISVHIKIFTEKNKIELQYHCLLFVSSMQFDFIQTPRLLLRQYTPQVSEYVFINYSDNDLKTFLGLSVPEELEKEKFRFNNNLTTFNKSFLYFHIVNKETSAVMGWCGYHTWYTDHNRAEIGYKLNNDEFKQQGFMAEALPPIIEFGFTQMQLHRIEAMVGGDNIPSLKLVSQNGFVKEGVLREHWKIDDIMDDSWMFSLLKWEWEEKLNR